MRKMNLQLFAAKTQNGVVGRWQHPGYLDVSGGRAGSV
jgi:hypothetical protein